MEPRSEDRGDPTTAATSPTRAPTPQWSRGPRTAVTSKPARTPGTTRSTPQWSRGPRTAVTGRPRPGGGAVRAAMEPRSEDRGDPGNHYHIPLPGEWPQWSRGPRTAVTGMRRGRLRPHRRAAMEPRSEDRGDSRSATGRKALREAAMEPRSEDRGDAEKVRYWCHEGLPAAMEPRSEDRGDTSRLVAVAGAESPQWSRGPRTAVTRARPPLPGGLVRHAAMEPRSEDRGDDRPRRL